MTKPVLFRVNNNLGIGGIQRRLRTILPRLADNFQVHVVTYRDKGVFFDELAKMGVKTHFVPLSGKWDPVGIWRMSRLFKKHRADIVHSHSLGGNISGTLAAALAKVPVKIGQVHHRGVHWYAPPGWRRKKQIIQETMVHKLFTDKVLFVSRESMHYFQKKTGLPAEKLMVLHNGLDFDALTPGKSKDQLRAELGIKPGKKIIGLVGRLVRGKGVDFFLDFARRVLEQADDYAFVLVGGGDRLDEFRALVHEWGLDDSLKLVGQQKDVYSYYNLFDCFLFTSEALWEGMPGTVLEACALGLPVLSRDSEPVREIMDYYPRIHIMADSADPLTAIEAAAGLPEADQARFRDEFSIRAMVERTENLYRELLEQA